jgi:spore coat protein CotH
MGTRPDGGYYPKDFLSNPNEYSEMWDSYQTKYPDFEDNDYRSDWQTLYDAVKFVCTSSNNVFKAQVSQYFDLPLVIDYYILMETILATDNHGKNMFFAVYDKQQDKRITFGVWDMDATSGQRWSDDYWHQSFLGPEQDYSKFIARYEHGDYNLFRRLRLTDADDFNMKVRQRYRELRQGPLATESILNRFRTQLDEFKTCGAANREYERWSYDSDVSYRQLDFDNEMEYLDDWFTRRMAYLDDVCFKIAELPDAITDLSAKGLASDVVYDLRGRQVGTTEHLDQLPPGIYLVNGRKIAVTK